MNCAALAPDDHLRYAYSFSNVLLAELRETMAIVSSSGRFTKPFLVVLLFALVFLELAILEVFLPYKWSHSIHQQSERIFPSRRYDPHPDMDWEFELDFQQHPSHKAFAYGVAAILAAGNAFLIARVWKVVRDKSKGGIAVF